MPTSIAHDFQDQIIHSLDFDRLESERMLIQQDEDRLLSLHGGHRNPNGAPLIQRCNLSRANAAESDSSSAQEELTRPTIRNNQGSTSRVPASILSRLKRRRPGRKHDQSTQPTTQMCLDYASPMTPILGGGLLTDGQKKRLEKNEKRFRQNPGTYAERDDRKQHCQIIALSDFEKSKSVCYCGKAWGLKRWARCREYQYCHVCAYARQAELRERFMRIWGKATVIHATLSFDGSMLLDAPVHPDPLDYFAACKQVIDQLYKDGIVSGAIWSEEIALHSLYPTTKIVPHCHVLLALQPGDSTPFSLAELIALNVRNELRRRSWGQSEPVNNTEEEDDDGDHINQIAEPAWDGPIMPPDVQINTIDSPEYLGNVLGYLVKTVDVLTPYHTAILAAHNEGPEGRFDVNTNLNDFLTALLNWSMKRCKIHYRGVLDARRKKEYIGGPTRRSRANREKHRATS